MPYRHTHICTCTMLSKWCKICHFEDIRVVFDFLQQKAETCNSSTVRECTMYSTCTLYSRVEWFSNFFDFWKPTYFLLIRYILRYSILKNGNFCHELAFVALAAKFSFFLIIGTLKINFFKICRDLPRSSKNNLQI